MDVFTQLESEVRGYCRGWPTVFNRALGSHVWDESGREYLDFFAGAGALNYGHNNPEIKSALLSYLAGDSIIHSLDMHTSAKASFLRTFDEAILAPRGLDYKIQFPGPAGNNAVEAALKLARKYTGRETVVSFTNAFHGMTLGALAVTGNSMKRGGAGIPLAHGTPMPYDQFLDGTTPDFFLFERMLTDSGSGLDKPAAVIVETVQGEGGINVSSPEWLRGLSELCKRHDMLLIVDDIQMGCGRTGPYFSFETAGITPDIVCMSKSLSGIGLPFALTLFKRGLDVWDPGEHNGTFRGFNPAFVTAQAALGFWADDHMEKQTLAKGDQIEEALTAIADEHADLGATVRGRGLAWGLAFDDPSFTEAVCSAAFGDGLLIETAGADSEVAKLMPPLTTSEDDLDAGLDILAKAVRTAR
ncbi:MAG: diaminobutyrate--2-oxoglutarate transaminase [Nocardiopsaceae bacterium]|nr:diaminobutyrate--2-oxoglutarate transaminase [Nocardiopsaceae bacterium]